MNDPRETLNRIRKQADNATKGPWVCTLNGDESEVTYANAPITWDDHGGEVFTEGDAEFIAHARTDLPALLAAVEDVLALHRPIEIEPSDTICAECSNQLPNGRFLPVVEWPCLTVTTIEEALG